MLEAMHEFLDDEGEPYQALYDGIYFAGNAVPVAARPIAEEMLRLAAEVARLASAAGEAEAALRMSPCGCSGGFRCSRCKALEALRPAPQKTRQDAPPKGSEPSRDLRAEPDDSKIIETSSYTEEGTEG